MAYGKVSMFEENGLVTRYIKILFSCLINISVDEKANYMYYSYLSIVNAIIVKMDT